MSPTHWKLENFIPKERLPLYVMHVAPGSHPSGQFHDHNTSEIVVILSGSATHIVKNGNSTVKNPVKTGDLLIIHPGVFHAYRNTGTLELINVVYDSRKLNLPELDAGMLPLFRKIFPKGNDFPQSSAAPEATFSPEKLARLRLILNELSQTVHSHEAGSLFEAMAQFMHLVITIAQMHFASDSGPQTPPDNIGKVLLRIAREYASPLTVESLARTANMSRRNFSRRFREATGNSCQQYLLLFRMEQAMELLKNPANDLSRIAIECGFYDSNYFCKRFRKIYGESPGIYRKRFIS